MGKNLLLGKFRKRGGPRNYTKRTFSNAKYLYVNIYLWYHNFARVQWMSVEKASNEFVFSFCQSQSALLLVMKMSVFLFRYFEQRKGLPDPKSSVSSELCTAAITQLLHSVWCTLFIKTANQVNLHVSSGQVTRDSIVHHNNDSVSVFLVSSLSDALQLFCNCCLLARNRLVHRHSFFDWTLEVKFSIKCVNFRNFRSRPWNVQNLNTTNIYNANFSSLKISSFTVVWFCAAYLLVVIVESYRYVRSECPLLVCFAHFVLWFVQSTVLCVCTLTVWFTPLNSARTTF